MNYFVFHKHVQLLPNYSKHIIDKINKRLFDVFGDQLPILKNLMQETGCVISGSFIINVC